MLIACAAIILTAHTGYLVVNRLVRLLARPSDTHWCDRMGGWGAGLPIGLLCVALAVKAGSLLGLGFQAASWLVFFGMLLLAAGSGLSASAHAIKIHRGSVSPITLKDAQAGSDHSHLTAEAEQKLFASGSYLKHSIIVLIGILTLWHVLLPIINNLSRPIFPWDAFTTWMFRAKAWVMSDEFSTLVNSAEWVSAGGASEYAIYADNYPQSISLFAGFVSALTGRWDPGAASLPWGAAFIALALLFFHLLRKSGMSTMMACIGVYALVSLPIIGAHAALAGYGDLWIAASSGSGLTALLLWRQQKDPRLLMLGLLLLVTGATFKLEGWVWLAMGLGFIGLPLVTARLGPVVSGLFALLAGAGLLMATTTQLELGGTFGSLGLENSVLHLGPLGSYPLRPYNPAGDYWSTLISNPNFHLVGVFYPVALITLSILKGRQSLDYWWMGGLIMTSQALIFGVSSYSVFAEIGTAVTRLLVQFSPVFVFTVLVAVSSLLHRFQQYDGVIRGPRLFASALTCALVITALAVTLAQRSLPASEGNRFLLPAAEMQPVLGRVEKSAQGIRFTHSEGAVGVIRSTRSLAASEIGRFVVPEIVSAGESKVSFYWINLKAPSLVHSVPIEQPNGGVLDLTSNPYWAIDDLKELGFILPKPAFDDVILGGLTIRNDLGLDLLPLWLKQWQQHIGPTQSSLNKLTEPPGVFPSLSGVISLSSSLMLLVALGCLIPLVATERAKRRELEAATIDQAHAGWAMLGLTSLTAAGLLWLVLDCRWLSELNDWAAKGLNNSTMNSRQAGHAGVMLTEPAVQALKALERSGGADLPTVILPLTPNDSFEAQKLSFLLLPLNSTYVLSPEAISLGDWTGNLILVSNNPEAMAAYQDTIAENAWDRWAVTADLPPMRVLMRKTSDDRP